MTRRAIRWSIVAVTVVLAAACSSSSPSTTAAKPSATTVAAPPDAGRPFAFTVQHQAFTDTSRPTATPGSAAYSKRRVLPTDIYLPSSSTPRPLILFAHGYHGAPRKFSQLFRSLARAGYVVAAPRFPLTSDRGAPYDNAGDVVNQPADMSFVLTQLLHGPLASRIDASRVGAAGLSLGGATTYNLIQDACCRDPRVRAAAVFDAVYAPIGGSFEKNRIPLLIAHIDTDLAVPYASAKTSFARSASPKYFLTFHNGVHAEAYENTRSPHDRTATQTSIDFFDMTLLGDTAARSRLMHDGNNPGESQIVAG